MKPLPAALVTIAVCTAAIALSNPLFPAAAAIAGGALLAAAGPPRRMYAAFAITTGLTVFALEPFVAVQGLTTLWRGPDIPILDTQITTEELAYGAAAGLGSPPRPWRSGRSSGLPTPTCCCAPSPASRRGRR